MLAVCSAARDVQGGFPPLSPPKPRADTVPHSEWVRGEAACCGEENQCLGGFGGYPYAGRPT